ncbi:MAG: recombinase family protein [Lachnospiraceae bacterium]|nr:recombinase family protein [Lachnospiraceae bacterium]MCM1239905.1 recombinase family protein [Lachnospiraceae bacterium]MCM1304497.1 recombinase family protein [Butyrivibrio sp.]MCM1343984.1 recombinase family protein [Muribaculaceae bacterium]MCM1411466.1 recombinase family protein [Lachnospiraceae bacterium]
MNIKKMIALYLRLSKHDEDIEEDAESNSIGNQRGILEGYVKKHLDTTGYEVKEFVDDGFSGTSMERPAMQELLKKVEKGEVYAILVKDLSRFARNYLKSAYYMEKVFPVFGVRFICVNDNYDSNNVAWQLPGMDMAFKGIIHDYYCKELSRKVKAARRQQMEKGKCIFARPPYGYWKSNTVKGLLVVDENTAPVVRNIFDQYLQGTSAYGIARELNRREIPSPNKRLLEAGLVTFRDEQYVKGMCWSNSAVLSILRSRIYIGDMVGGKEERVRICDRNCRKRDKEEWIIVQDTHEPIIEREIFCQVQDMLREKAKARERRVGSYTRK